MRRLHRMVWVVAGVCCVSVMLLSTSAGFNGQRGNKRGLLSAITDIRVSPNETKETQTESAPISTSHQVRFNNKTIIGFDKQPDEQPDEQPNEQPDEQPDEQPNEQPDIKMAEARGINRLKTNYYVKPSHSVKKYNFNNVKKNSAIPDIKKMPYKRRKENTPSKYNLTELTNTLSSELKIPEDIPKVNMLDILEDKKLLVSPIYENIRRFGSTKNIEPFHSTKNIEPFDSTKNIEPFDSTKNIEPFDSTNEDVLPSQFSSSETSDVYNHDEPIPQTRWPRDSDRFELSIKEPERPSNVSRIKSPFYPWGKHQFGPLQAYSTAPPGMHWNAYFYEQTLAVVLEDVYRNIINCTLLEIVPEHEQRVALQTLGLVMALVPLTLQQIILLTPYCRSPEEWAKPKPMHRRTIAKKDVRPETLFLHASTALMGLVPGTVWCGRGDRAKVYHQLGMRPELDQCCRAHDHCPIKLKGGATNYGTTNTGSNTVSHCRCDEAFLRCLEDVSKYDEVVPIVGTFFFNILRMDCLAHSGEVKKDSGVFSGREKVPGPTVRGSRANVYKPKLECVSYAPHDRSCRQWLHSPTKTLKLSVISPNFNFKT